MCPITILINLPATFLPALVIVFAFKKEKNTILITQHDVCYPFVYIYIEINIKVLIKTKSLNMWYDAFKDQDHRYMIQC